MTPPHPLTNFEIQEYYQNEPRFKGVFSRDNLPNNNNDNNDDDNNNNNNNNNNNENGAYVILILILINIAILELTGWHCM